MSAERTFMLAVAIVAVNLFVIGFNVGLVVANLLRNSL